MSVQEDLRLIRMDLTVDDKARLKVNESDRALPRSNVDQQPF
jgi:hypothetical protein